MFRSNCFFFKWDQDRHRRQQSRFELKIAVFKCYRFFKHQIEKVTSGCAFIFQVLGPVTLSFFLCTRSGEKEHGECQQNDASGLQIA